MTNNAVDRAARDLFDSDARATRNIRFFFSDGDRAETLADYRARAITQIQQRATQPIAALDSHLLD